MEPKVQFERKEFYIEVRVLLTQYVFRETICKGNYGYINWHTHQVFSSYAFKVTHDLTDIIPLLYLITLWYDRHKCGTRTKFISPSSNDEIVER